ncbi:MAG TPA: GTPase HflX, partial [Fibrobacteres bacterium]|nr:GTPase HflX [Fibrobacterota bacterium]
PHHLVASFKSTLEVVSEADMLLIVMDGSSDWAEHQLQTVNEVLKDLATAKAPRLLVFNKMDRVSDPFERKRLSVAFPHAVFVSAFNDTEMLMLKKHIADSIAIVNKERAMADIIAHTTSEFDQNNIQ